MPILDVIKDFLAISLYALTLALILLQNDRFS